MDLVINSTIKNKLIHWIDDDGILASFGNTLYRSSDGGVSFEKVLTIVEPVIIRQLSRFELITRGLRLGVRCLLKLKSKTIILVVNRKVYRVNNGNCEIVYRIRSGAGPLRMALCEDNEGNCYMGEYLQNKKRQLSNNLIKSNDDGKSWEIVHSFIDIRHIHLVQYDPYANGLWVGTGDYDSESALYYSNDHGVTFSPILSGHQAYRTLSLIFTPTHIYWGSDIPTQENHIYRLNRKSMKIEVLVDVQGPIYYSAMLDNGTIVFASNAEGHSEGKSPYLNNKAEIWASHDGEKWENIAAWGKDRYPYIMGYGTIFFPRGKLGNDIYLSGVALQNIGNKLIRAKIV